MKPRRRAYLVIFPCILGLTFANPFLRNWVAANLTSHHTYYRLWWLLPVGPGLAILFALGVRFLSRLAEPAQTASRVLVPLGFAAVGLAVTCALPGIYVWGARNSFIGPLGTPHLADNLEKMPGDLVPLARHMAADAEMSAMPILCNEEVASFLAPYARQFRFVQLRLAPYIGGPLSDLEGYLLIFTLRNGSLPRQLGSSDVKLLRAHCGEATAVGVQERLASDATDYLRHILSRFRVKYIVAAPGDRPGRVFEDAGYKAVSTVGAFTLWQVGEMGYAPPPPSRTIEGLTTTSSR
jgi:hypothetical protein